MTTPSRSHGSFLVVRTWREADGPLCARVGAVTDPEVDSTRWEPCVGIEQTLEVVRAWLQRWSLDAPVAPHR